MDSLVDTIARAPALPGVYLFKDRAGKVIYVGKARSLADRLPAYVGTQPDLRHQALMAEAVELDCIVTGSEVEALVLEENLIKLNKPRFNVLLKDDKKFPYLKLTVKEPYPGLYVTRNLKPDGSVFFGPYTNARALRRAVRATRRIFKLRACRKPLPLTSPVRACLNRHMGRCLGPCQGEVAEDAYRRRVKAVVAFLSGRNDALESELEKQMWQASEAQDFEQAANRRDQLMALRDVRRHQPVVARDKANRDAVGLVLGERSAQVVILKVREGKLVGKSEYGFSVARHTGEAEVIATLLRTGYGHTYDLPDEILVPAMPEEAEGFVRWFKEKRDREITITKPDRGAKLLLLKLAKRNAEREFVDARHAPRVPAGNLALAEVLSLKAPPRRLEGIDISNISGRHAVGAIVVFSDDRPLKTEYRRFRIRTVSGPNDFAMMTEVLSRRLKRVIAEKKPLPDLLLIDGGKGQLSAARAAYEEAGRQVPMLGFAKRTDLVYYADGREIQIPARSPALRLLKQVRDEAHRFAITYHRKIRDQGMTDSLLDALPGIGEKRRQALLRHFGSLTRIRGASLAELRQVPGIGPALARKFYDVLHS
jgi:excinuclease ABC subunit C